MNLNQLRFARAVAESGSFSKAAEACFVTQPSLSNAIVQLEDELGGRLFSRTTRSVSISPFGRHMLPLIEAVLEAQQELKRSAEAYHNPKHELIRVGLSPLIDVQLVERLLAPFREARPGVEIFYKQCFLADMEERIAQGTVDVALVPRRLARIGRERAGLYSEPLYYLPREHDGAAPMEEGAAALDACGGEPVILTNGCGLSDAIADLYKAEGVAWKRYPGQALSYRVVEEWAELGVGAGILPRSKLSPGNGGARPIRLAAGGVAEVRYEAQWMPEVTERAHLAAFIRHLREAVPARLAGMGAERS